MSESPFIVGAVVAVYSAGRWSLPRPFKRAVSKVHKNGNFIIGDTPQQWKPALSGWGDKEWQAWRAGQSRYSGDTCEIWSEKHDQMLADADNASRWFSACNAIDKASRRPPDDAALIDALEDVVKRMSPPPAKPTPNSPE